MNRWMVVLPRGVAVAGVLTALAGPARELSAQFDDVNRFVTFYSGKITWLNKSTDADGSGVEQVDAFVVDGQVVCHGGWTSPDRSAPIHGPGLLKITVGLNAPNDTIDPTDPDAFGGRTLAQVARYNDSVRAFAKANSRAMYTIEVACPMAQYDPTRPARWSHKQDSYPQVGGRIRGDNTPPDTLKGGWSETHNDGNGGTSSVTISWLLCERLCTPRPPPP